MRAVVCVSEGAAWPRLREASRERHHVEELAECLAGMAGDHQLVVVYEGDPYLQMLVDEQWAMIPAPRLDVLTAEEEAAAGYLLAHALRNTTGGRRVAALLTQVCVDPADEAWRRPSVPVGPVCGEEDAGELAAQGWLMCQVAGGWRRSVPAPTPLGVIESDAVELLLAAGVLVVCAAGGIPVVTDAGGRLRAVPAVCATEATAAAMAAQIHADRLIYLHARPGGSPAEQRVPAHLEVAKAAAQLEGLVEGEVVAGACRFARLTGRTAAIGALWDGARVLQGESGYQIDGAPAPAGV